MSRLLERHDELAGQQSRSAVDGGALASSPAVDEVSAVGDVDTSWSPLSGVSETLVRAVEVDAIQVT